MSKRPLVPSFLQKIDERLLKSKPATWAARTHLVVYFALLFGIVLAAFCYLAFFDAKKYSNIGSWVYFIGLLAFIGFIFWLIFLLRFNVFKRFGNWFDWDGLKGFALYFICIGSMVAVCFIPSAVATFRANQQFSSDEIVSDINEMNVDACKLEYDILPKEWKIDSVKVIKRPVEVSNETVTMDTAAVATVAVPIKDNYQYIDTSELKDKIIRADSLTKINDSFYVFYTCPDYTFLRGYRMDEHLNSKTLGSVAIYNSIIKNYQKPQRAPLIKRMEELKLKYAANSRYSYYDYEEGGEPTYKNDDTYDIKITKKYGLTRISNGIENITEKKYEWSTDWNIYLRVFYYVTLVLTLLVFIYRHTTVKTFFLSLLTAVLLMIFTGLFLVMGHGRETSILSFIVVYYVIFLGLALSTYNSQIRNVIQGIGINCLLFMTPFMPLVFVTLYQVNEMMNYDFKERNRFDNSELYLLIAEIAGSVIFIVLLEPFFRKLYRKWYAAPEN